MIIITLKNNLWPTIILATALMSSSCSTIKDLRRIPESQKELSNIFSEATPSGWSETALEAWPDSITWNDLDDPYLHDLIDQALENNISLKNSYLTLDQAINNFKIVKQQRKVQYGAGGTASVVKVLSLIHI